MSHAAALEEPILGMLAQSAIVRVATITPRGRPHVAPFWFACDGERIVVSTLSNQTVRNLRHDSACAVLVDLGSDFRDLRGALIQGRASIYGPADAVPSTVSDALSAIDRAHAAELEEPEFARYDTWETRDHIALEITPVSATWFDLGLPGSGRTGEPDERGGPR